MPAAWRRRSSPASVSETRRGPPGPLDEPLADHALERLDLLADRGLRVSEPLRGAAERALLGHRLERGQMPQFDPEPSIRSHNRNES